MIPEATLFQRPQAPRLIGIHGFKRSGKDEVFKAIQNLYGDGDEEILRVSFADKMKAAAAVTLGYDPHAPEDHLVRVMDAIKDNGAVKHTRYGFYFGVDAEQTGRDYLIDFGQGMRAILGENVWVDKALPKTQEMFAYGFENWDLVVVTDVRMENEAQRVLDLGGTIWEVTRPGAQSDGTVTETRLPEHMISKTLVNDGDLDDLAYEVQEAL